MDAKDYYSLVEEARSLGIPTSLDDPRSPRTVAGLQGAVDRERAIRQNENGRAIRDTTDATGRREAR